MFYKIVDELIGYLLAKRLKVYPTYFEKVFASVVFMIARHIYNRITNKKGDPLFFIMEKYYKFQSTSDEEIGEVLLRHVMEKADDR